MQQHVPWHAMESSRGGGVDALSFACLLRLEWGGGSESGVASPSI